MSRSATRSSYKVTFAVLLLGTIAYSLLQSLVSPVLPTIQHDLHTDAEHRHLGADRLPPVGVDLHPHPRTGRRHGRQGADAGGHAGRTGRRLGGRRSGPLDHRADHRPGHPGHRRRRAPALLRHRPRRVPRGQGGGSRRHHRRHGGRGRRRRHRAGRPDRQPPGLPLAVLDPDGDRRRRHRRRLGLRARVPGAHAGADQLAGGRAAVRVAGGAPARRQRGPVVGLGLRPRPRPRRRRRWC